jgi:hypothetical protein
MTITCMAFELASTSSEAIEAGVSKSCTARLRNRRLEEGTRKITLARVQMTRRHICVASNVMLRQTFRNKIART